MRAKSMHAGYTCIHFRDQSTQNHLRKEVSRSPEAWAFTVQAPAIANPGVDVPGAVKRDGFYRGYFLVVFFKPLSDEETIEKFEPIPFDSTDADMKRILESLAKYDCKEQEMEGRWKTFSEWSFVEHIEPKVDG
ncbi:hypothetical protein ACEPAF_1638 [Sanghuangporus sanghuang]